MQPYSNCALTTVQIPTIRTLCLIKIQNAQSADEISMEEAVVNITYA